MGGFYTSRAHATRARQRGAMASSGGARQLAFHFLGAVPQVERRAQRAFRPHLRERTRAGAEQFVLPLTSPRGAPRYCGVEAIYLEEALHAARADKAGAVEHLLALTRPEVAEVAKARWRPACGLTREDLEHEGELELLRLNAWDRFTPGRERGRTLWPAYARRLASQAMGRALEGLTPVKVTQWARRQRKAAVEEVHTKVPFRQFLGGRWVRRSAVRVERVELPATHTRVASRVVAVPLEAAEHVSMVEHPERADQARALVALSALPVRIRVAVAGPMGLLREGVVGDGELARHLGTTVEGVRELREEGLRQLRSTLVEE